jgi:hypothetical protein
MIAPQFSTTAEQSLGRDVLNAARNYLGNRWAGWRSAAWPLSSLACLSADGAGWSWSARRGAVGSSAPMDHGRAAHLTLCAGAGVRVGFDWGTVWQELDAVQVAFDK